MPHTYPPIGTVLDKIVSTAEFILTVGNTSQWDRDYASSYRQTWFCSFFPCGIVGMESITTTMCPESSTHHWGPIIFPCFVVCNFSIKKSYVLKPEGVLLQHICTLFLLTNSFPSLKTSHKFIDTAFQCCIFNLFLNLQYIHATELSLLWKVNSY